MAMTADFDPDDPRGITIATVSDVLGVPMPTIRSWELRYGIPGLDRGHGKHRRYSPTELHSLRLMRDEIARGHKASTAAQLVLALVDSQGPADGYVRAILADSEQMDPGSIRSGLDAACAELGLPRTIDDVLLPAMRQVGVWWSVGHCDEVQERMATEAVRAWLNRSSAYAPQPSRLRSIVLACGPSDLHTIGVESLALLLRHAGWPCRVLGARTTTDTVTTAARAADSAAVVIVSHLATGRLRAIASINAVHDLGIEVFFAGNAFSTNRSRRNVPGTYLGGRIETACSRIVETLSPAAPTIGSAS